MVDSLLVYWLCNHFNYWLRNVVTFNSVPPFDSFVSHLLSTVLLPSQCLCLSYRQQRILSESVHFLKNKTYNAIRHGVLTARGVKLSCFLLSVRLAGHNNKHEQRGQFLETIELSNTALCCYSLFLFTAILVGWTDVPIAPKTLSWRINS